MEMMNVAVQEAFAAVEREEGFPFGAVIVHSSTGNVLARAHNMSLQTNDPTAHAEVACIRLACARLGTLDLSVYIIYSSCEPCPMCFGAIHWARIPRCFYATKTEDAAEIDDVVKQSAFIYRAIRREGTEPPCQMIHMAHPNVMEVYTKK